MKNEAGKRRTFARLRVLTRAASLWLALCALLCAISACAALQKPSDDEIRQVLSDLLPRSYDATYLIYGPGAPYDESFEVDPSWTVPHYAPVRNGYKYQTEEQVRELLLATFTKEYALEMWEYAFEGNDSYLSRYGTDKGKLTIDVTKKPLGMADEIFVSTAHVTAGSAYACEVEVEYTAGGIAEHRTMTIKLVKEDGAWLFDGPTY